MPSFDPRTITEAAPLDVFRAWFSEAEASEPNDPNAMTLATVGEDGAPSARMVLLKGWDERGFVFYTNQQSRKGVDLTAHPKAALLFHWKSLRRQVRIEGPTSPVSEAEADAYFASRPRVSRLGAAASDQSRPLSDRSVFEARVAELDSRYQDKEIPRPGHWSGYRVQPLKIEFWQDMPFRLHDRTLFTKSTAGWEVIKLYP